MNPAQRYTVQHETRYAYTAPVSQSWQLARLTPRALPWQRLIAHSLRIVQMPPHPHSATAVRERAAAGLDVTALVGAPVARYIADHHLYTSPK